MTVSFGDLELDQLGRVVLSEDDINEIEALGWVCAGGNDGQTNSGSCVNTSSCNNTTNGQCTNASGACDKARNATKCIQAPQQDQIELEP